MKNNRHRTDGAFCSPGAQAADPGMPGLRNKLASISFERIAFGVVLEDEALSALLDGFDGGEGE